MGNLRDILLLADNRQLFSFLNQETRITVNLQSVYECIKSFKYRVLGFRMWTMKIDDDSSETSNVYLSLSLLLLSFSHCQVNIGL